MPYCCRWVLGTKCGKISGEFPASMLWSKASNTSVVAFSVNTADIIFERGEWSSKWIRGRTARTTCGQYTSGDKPRCTALAQSALAAQESELDFPMRVQVNLTADPKRLELIFTALPCKYGDAGKLYKGLVGEAKR